ncbi:MAG: hypothetical protein RSB41_00595 [Bacilli bacterium]
MKNAIFYYYNLSPLKVYQKLNSVYFYIDDIKYIFMPFNRDVSEVETLINISNTLFKKGVLVHTFIINKYNSFICNYNDTAYVLLRVNDITDDEVTLQDIIKFDNSLVLKNNITLLGNSWGELWEIKIDNIEKSISDLNQEYPLIRSSVSYFIGIGENALEYANNALIEAKGSDELRYVVSHRRIIDNINYDYLYNPLTFTIDYDVRDIAEYIKMMFFSKKFDFMELEDMMNKYKLSDLQAKLLYSRLLYPTYYFDLIEEIILGNRDEKDIIIITDLVSNYEDLLFDIYNLIKKYNNIPPIEWILRQKE